MIWEGEDTYQWVEESKINPKVVNGYWDWFTKRNPKRRKRRLIRRKRRLRPLLKKLKSSRDLLNKRGRIRPNSQIWMSLHFQDPIV